LARGAPEPPWCVSTDAILRASAPTVRNSPLSSPCGHARGHAGISKSFHSPPEGRPTLWMRVIMFP